MKTKDQPGGDASRAVADLIAQYAGVAREHREQTRRELLEALGGLADEHPVWVALNKLLAIHMDMEHRAAKDMTLTPPQRDFNNGREAGLEDFRMALWRLRAEARKG